MKKLWILVVSALACACGGQTYVINGNLGEYNGMAYIYNPNKLDKYLDSVAVVDGKFTLTGKVEYPALRILHSGNGEYTVYYIEEAGQVTISADAMGNVDRVGAPLNEKLTAYTDAPKALLAEYHDPETTAERRAEIEEEFARIDRETLEANRDNYLGFVLLSDQRMQMSGQELLAAIAQFPAELQKHPEVVELKQKAEQMARIDVGQPYIEIAATTPAGEEVSLQSVVEANRYTLLDFWASWCGPCMGEVPHLKAAYAEFHNKGFEVYGYSFDSKADMWTAAIEREEMNWVQVSTLDGFDNEAGKLYSVEFIPTNYLIDSEGKIVAKNLRGEALYAKLAELLND